MGDAAEPEPSNVAHDQIGVLLALAVWVVWVGLGVVVSDLALG